MAEEKLLTPEEVAARLGMAPLTVIRWLRAGKLPGRKLGRKFWRMRAADLDAFIQEPPRLRLVEPPAPSTSAAEVTPQARKAALVSRLRAMHAQGLSHHAIATKLNVEGVPTLSGKGTWQKGTVSNLLAQEA
jgi:excisionase family DNA binding protein